jgi:hypothetical protein
MVILEIRMQDDARELRLLTVQIFGTTVADTNSIQKKLRAD